MPSLPLPGDVAFQPRAVDRDLLEAMRGRERCSIQDLVDALGVTAPAVRQRVDRLLEAGLIDREKQAGGRGRPTFSYGLTVLGHRQAGANYAELAEAMWQEVLSLADPALRQQLLVGIARRLGRRFRNQLRGERTDEPSPLQTRMEALSEVLAQQRIPNGVSLEGAADGLPVLDISTCPYPNLTDDSEQRAMCHLEEEMLSEALGQPVHLTSCRLDGDACCQFSPAAAPNEPAS
jgi:predicted ArsR family transcriptional regulator